MKTYQDNDAIENAYVLAKASYARMGVDTDAALKIAAAIPLSIHCWQGDDVAARSGSEISAKGGPCMSLTCESEKVIEQCVPDPASRACAR